LPIALEFAKSMKVVGFDINQKRVDMMRNNIDPSEELSILLLLKDVIYFLQLI
jgi:UDP-N-acetyl-D-mannosaminuronate dehydrogenase